MTVPTMAFHLRAVRPTELRDDVRSLERLFRDDRDTVRGRVRRHREEILDRRYLDHELLYAGSPPYPAEDGPRADVILGGRPVFHSGPRPPFLLLTAAEAERVAGFLGTADFAALWHLARADLLPRYGGAGAEPRTRGTFAAAHRDLRTFYATAAEHGDAVVKWLVL
ncbi:DUF1877 domain-containing protein [Streptomyces sp. NPDC006739]|uniref:DUF1877 domain-containing protein n=1 Tax=Streptomyces sp. NPDC006739 TaxID=3364763 RepID=UPI0036B556E3